MSKIVIGLILILLSGCSSMSWDSLPEEPIVVHPDLPRPIEIHIMSWLLFEYDKQNVVGVPYDDFLNLLDTQYSTHRYIEQLRKSVCFYRKDLQEEFCMLEYNSNEEKLN